MVLKNYRWPLAVGVVVVAVIATMITLGVRTPRASTPVVVSGVSQWGALARAALGGDARVVTLLSDPNADPHSHEATTSDAAYVDQASIVIENGAGYDTWLSQLVGARASRPIVINVASLVGVKTGSNPHLFYDVTAARRFVETLVSKVATVSNSTHVHASAAAVLASLRGLEVEVATLRSRCGGVNVAATEDVTGYLLASMGLHVITPESLRLAVGNSVDPSVGALATALDQLRTHPAFLVNNTQTATPLTNEMVSVARRNHVPVINVTETMVGTNYDTWMGRTIASMRSDLVLEGCA
jgi:zinc/manganese transport system substrate-binding protein